MKASNKNPIEIIGLYNDLLNIITSKTKGIESDDWATGHGINEALEEWLGENVHIIPPDRSSVESPAAFDKDNALEGAIQYAKEISGFSSNGEMSNNHIIYKDGETFKKPIIMILNTNSIKVSLPTDATARGGNHWQCCVILPKHYKPPYADENLGNEHEIIFYIDSFHPNVKLPRLFHQLLTEGIEYKFEVKEGQKYTHIIPGAFAGAEIIDGTDICPQVGGSDCGWWAVYNAMMIVFTGNLQYLNQFKEKAQNKELTREPGYKLRALLPSLTREAEVGEKNKSKSKQYWPEEISQVERIAIQQAIENSLNEQERISGKINESLYSKKLTGSGKVILKSKEENQLMKGQKEKGFELSHKPIKPINSKQITRAQKTINISIQERLQSLYLKQNKLPPFLEKEEGIGTFDSNYINLAIIDLKVQQKLEAKLLSNSLNALQEVELELDSLEDNINESNIIAINSLFNKCSKNKEKLRNIEKKRKEKNQDNGNRKILIHGKAGIGKTTLMKYITYNWAQGKLWNEFDYVFLLPLRQLNNFQEKNHFDGLESFIIKCCLSYGTANLEILQEIKEIKDILSNGKALLLLDGYDELNPQIENKDFVHAVFEAALNGLKLNIIMTSRPNLVDSKYRQLFDIQVVNIGFNDANIDNYIKINFKGKEEEKQSLLTLIRENRTIQGMCHTPINLHLLCLIWIDLITMKQATLNNKKLTTTMLYVEIVDWLIRRSANREGKELKDVKNLKHSQIEREYESSLRLIEKIAFEGLKKGIIVLEKGLLNKVGVDTENYKEIQKIGLLKAIDDEQNNNTQGGIANIRGNIEKEHYFVHSTFQDYMAARYLVRMFNSNNEQQIKAAIEFLDNIKYIQKYERMIYFIAGIVSLDREQSIQPTQALLHFWNIMINGKIDLNIHKQFILIIKCMDESGIDERIPDIEKIRDYLRSTVTSIREVKGKKVLGKIPERIEEWLNITKPIKELNNEKNGRDIRIYLIKLQNGNNKEKLESIEKLKRINIKDIEQKEVVEVLLESIKRSDGIIHTKIREMLNYLEIHTKDEELKASINDALMNERIRENEVTEQVKRWVEGTCGVEVDNNIKAIKDKDGLIRYLLLLLKDKSNEVRIKAIEALGKLNVTDDKRQFQIVNLLMQILLKDNSNDVCNKAAETLAKLNITNIDLQNNMVSTLTLLLENQSKDNNRRATEILAKFNITNVELQSKMIRILLPMVGGQNRENRHKAIEALSMLNIIDIELQNQVVIFLLSLLENKESCVRNSATDILGKMNITDLKLRNKVINSFLLKLKLSSETQIDTAEALSKLNITDTKIQDMIIDALLHLIEDKNKWIRSKAVEILGKFNITDIKFQDRITNILLPLLLKDEDRLIWGSIIEILVKFNSTNIETRNKILNAVLLLSKSSNSDVHRRAVETLVKLNITDTKLQDQIITSQISLLRSRSQQICDNVIFILDKLNIIDVSLQRTLITGLFTLVEDNDIKTFGNAIKVLDSLQIVNKIQISSTHSIKQLISLLINLDKSYKNDNTAEIIKLRIMRILNKLLINDPIILKEIFESLLQKFMIDRLNLGSLLTYFISLLNLFMEKILIQNVIIYLQKDLLLFSLPLFKQAAVVVDKDKVIINYRGCQRELPFAKDETDMAYQVFNYFWQQHISSNTAICLLDYRLNFSKMIQISKLDTKLGTMTLSRSNLQHYSYSCINDSIRLNCQRWIISIIRKSRRVGNSHHAFLLIEGRNIFHEAELYRLELLQPNAEQFPKRGRIEIIEEAHIDVSKAGELARLYQIMLGNTRYNGNNGFEIDKDYYHKSCVAGREIAMQIINQAKAERSKAAEITYDFYGKNAPNCFTWIRKKFKDYLEPEEYKALQLEGSKKIWKNDPIRYLGKTTNLAVRYNHYAKDGLSLIKNIF